MLTTPYLIFLLLVKKKRKEGNVLFNDVLNNKREREEIKMHLVNFSDVIFCEKCCWIL